MNSIKSRMLFYFCSMAAAIILLILLAVHFTLKSGIKTQFESLTADMAGQETLRLGQFQNMLDRHLKSADKDVARLVREVCGHPDIRRNAEFAQLDVLEPEHVQTRSAAIIGEVLGLSKGMLQEGVPLQGLSGEDASGEDAPGVQAKLDFAVIWGLDGRVLVSYPKNNDPAWLANSFAGWDLVRRTQEAQAVAEEKVLAEHMRIPPELLRAVGADDDGIPDEAAAMVHWCLVRDSSSDPVGYCLAGKLYNRFQEPLSRFYESVGAPSVIFLGEQPVVQSGFLTGEGSGGLAQLALKPEAMRAVYDRAASESVVSRFLGKECMMRGVPLKTPEGEVLGMALAALPMERIEAVERTLEKHGKDIQFKVRTWIFGIGLCAIGAFFLLAWAISSGIVRPIAKIALMMKDMAEGEGDLSVRLDVPGRDEVSDLARWFNLFVDRLRSLVMEIKEGSEILAISASQISATATELASSSSETSSSISEISTTMEEVKQTTSLASEKAGQVSEAAEHVARSSESGRKATEEAVAGMNRIKEEMEYIAESIVKLSEQTQSIGDIIDAVNDLANESNLLSVNASIEAAKAGEFGKGFAVVAQEVKSLSDQSKQATAQVRTILNDIQSATSTAVMATERGSKAVDNGVMLSAQSGDTINTLVDSVSESSRAAAQIAASSHQQLAGMDQLTQAMMSIKDASLQNVDGARHLENAISDMNELGQTLKELAGSFKV